VGEPAPQPFEPAPFQRAALEALAHGDVLVSAPTGSGKTWIAEQEILRVLRESPAAAPGRIWYTTPLKALSNQKFRRFQGLYGAEAVGLLTGERRVNPHAPVLVATTEILRNALYDLHETPPEVVVLDEAHYLADPERGTAWEEILLLAPQATRLLLLSATVPNADQLAAWMGTVRGRRPEVIVLEARPVPLAYLLADGSGRLLGPDPRNVRTRNRHPRWLLTLADALAAHRLVPAILFFPSRRECDEAARALGSRPAPGEAERRERLREWIARVPQLSDHPLLTPLRRGGVAPHHAGHLTAWRMCVEELLEAGLVRLVCATTTLAAGLDVPARTVVLSTLYRHGPSGPEPLSATEFHQMTGRAGRRGKDTLGVVVLVTPTPDEAREGLALSSASPDPVTSAFAPSDAQVLNLLSRMRPEAAEDLLRRSFAAYLRAPETETLRARLASLPPDPLVERPCTDRLATRRRFDGLLRRLRRARRRKESGSPEVAQLARAVLEMPCTGCPVTARCLASLPELRAVERERKTLARELSAREDLEVRQFRARAEVLQGLGYLDAEGRPTPWGRLAARLRHPRMLVIAEALRRGLLPTHPPALAAVAGALGTERVTGMARAPFPRGRWRAGPGRGHGDEGGRPDLRSLPEGASPALASLRRLVSLLNVMLGGAGLPTDPLEEEFAGSSGGGAQALWRAAIVGAWAGGSAWNVVTVRFRIPDGDLQRLIWQAAEILTQLEDLAQPDAPKGAHAVAEAARVARETLLRPPVL